MKSGLSQPSYEARILQKWSHTRVWYESNTMDQCRTHPDVSELEKSPNLVWNRLFSPIGSLSGSSETGFDPITQIKPQILSSSPDPFDSSLLPPLFRKNPIAKIQRLTKICPRQQRSSLINEHMVATAKRGTSSDTHGAQAMPKLQRERQGSNVVDKDPARATNEASSVDDDDLAFFPFVPLVIFTCKLFFFPMLLVSICYFFKKLSSFYPWTELKIALWTSKVDFFLLLLLDFQHFISCFSLVVLWFNWSYFSDCCLL